MYGWEGRYGLSVPSFIFGGTLKITPRRAIFPGPAANNQFKFLFVQLETKAIPSQHAILVRRSRTIPGSNNCCRRLLLLPVITDSQKSIGLPASRKRIVFSAFRNLHRCEMNFPWLVR